MSLPSWELLSEPELLQAWAMNLMVINVSTRKYARAVRLPDDAGGDLPAASGDATSKSAVSRRFVALTRSKLKAWLARPARRSRSRGAPDRRAPCRRSPDGGGDRHRHRRREARAGPGRGRDGERGHGASHARQPDRARSRSRTASALHRRRRQGALEGDPADLRAGGGPPALPGAQGAQHHGPAGREPPCRRQEGLAAGLAAGRRGQGRTALAQPRPPSGA